MGRVFTHAMLTAFSGRTGGPHRLTSTDGLPQKGNCYPDTPSEAV